MFCGRCSGQKWGLILLWKKELEVDIINFLQRHISGWVEDYTEKCKCMFTVFYGHPKKSKRKGSWELLESLRSPDQHLWYVLGDFNEIVSQTEKECGRPRNEGQIEQFRKVREECRLFDLGWRGSCYTWSNNHSDKSFTKERLDRGVANQKWSEFYTDTWVEILAACSSDHKPLLLHMSRGQHRNHVNRKKFKYEVCWALEEDCSKVVRRNGRMPNPVPMNRVHEKLNLYREALSK